jgi:hypothetical protein
MAPEVIRSTKYDYKCDQYSFAIIMYQIFTNCNDDKIYPEEKLGGNNIEFVLSTDQNFRPEINEEFQKEIYKPFIKNFIGNFFFKIF